ncbi:FG-GAP-like repeat-containing protein [Stieleria varia]|uniref:ASPIC and UnbV n=1 Tax=Stieleria varia TaxID=2528005 RepID=A0A5C6B9E8_9BACT|nr:ASPIC/UnbV domain-containing protein [Stieleria varia]TWU08061.1 ASPIC and UnbV [Stieleria varia]
MTDPTIESSKLRRQALNVLFGIALTLALTGGCSNNSETDPTNTAATSGESNAEISAETKTTGDDTIRNATTETKTAASEKTPPPLSREERLDAVLELQTQNKHDQAAKILQGLIIEDPTDYVAVFHLANSTAAQGNLRDAVELLAGIPPSDPDSGLPALGVSADWCMQLEQFDQAEEKYRKILQLMPEFNIARRRLAYLLNRQGRRHEANALIRELCKAGDVTQEELYSLIVESDAMYDPPGEAPVDGANPYWPIGPLAEARQLFTLQRYAQAADLIQPLIDSGGASQAAVAFCGLMLAESQQDDRFVQWLRQTSDETKEFPEYWAALGIHLARETRYEESIGAFAQALRGDPSDHRSVRRMILGFRSVAEPTSAEAFTKRFQTLNRVITLSNQIATADGSQAKAMAELADALEQMGRRLEATMWRSLVAVQSPNRDKDLQALNQTLRRLVADDLAFPSLEERLCGVDMKDFPLPEFELPTIGPPDGPVLSPPFLAKDFPQPELNTQAIFRNIAAEIGLQHRYQVAASEQTKAFAIYQQLGGGVAVLDFDLDGWCDLYFAQGDADPPQFVARQSDQLYRHLANVLANKSQHRLVDATDLAGLHDQQYTIGVSAGDWNQDGFPDLVTSNMGVNRLYINQGDGTFVSQALDAQRDLQRCPSSLAIGDVTGDHLPDIVAVNYVRDSEVTRKPSLNSNGYVDVGLSPLEFQAGQDQLYKSSPDGQWVLSTLGDTEETAKQGLGVVVTGLDDQRGNEILVGNDAVQNQLWSRLPTGDWVDRSIARGCAFGARGLATAAMGIAVGDLDRSGTVDFHITNFSDEPVSLYLQEGGTFRDLCIRFGLVDDSVPLVGFGTQPLDFNNDGWLDLVIANGHVDDLGSADKPFRQRLQLFANAGSRFELIDVAEDPYWSQPHSGRALAMLDFDRDGRQDFVVTNLLESSSLLLNETVQANHWIKIGLVGTNSERDAIGARVTITSGARQWSHWVTSGDGYLCKNESEMHVGLGDTAAIDHIDVQWPDGTTQTFQDIPIDQKVLLIQGQPTFQLQ